MNVSSVMSGRKLRITLLADEWKSSKGGLSTMNRELAIQFAKHPNVAVTFFVPKCTEDDKKAANSHGITIVKAKERPGFESIYWLCFPPSDLVIDIIIGHGVKLGKQAQVIRDYHHCTWVQVVHTAPEELAMFKPYSGAISKGDEKQWDEVNLCKIADLIVAVGPKLHEFYAGYLSSCDKNVFNLTPGIFTELSTLKLSHKEAKKFRVLVFGRGDSEDFELKGFDIAAKAVAELNDKSYHLIFVGAPSGNEDQVAEKLLEQGLSRSQLTVKGYLENRDDLALLLSRANLAIIPSRTEGFGLTALEALSAGLPFLVSQNSGFGEALQEIPTGSSWVVDSEDPEQWAEAIKAVREKGRETALKECQELRTRYAGKYSWEKQCNDLVEMMGSLVNFSASEVEPAAAVAPLQNRSQAADEKSQQNVEGEGSLTGSKGEMGQAVPNESQEHLTGILHVKDELEMPQMDSVSEPGGKQVNGKSVGRSRQTSSLQEDQPATEQRREAESGCSDICTVTANTAAAKSNQGARPKEMFPSSPEETKLKEQYSASKPESAWIKQLGAIANEEEVSLTDSKEQYSASKPVSAWIKQLEAIAKDTSLPEKKVVIICRDQFDVFIIKDLFGEEQLRKVHIFSGRPEAVSKLLLSTQTSRSCIIVVNAKTIEEELHHKSGGTPYEDLLRAAIEEVETKVVTIIYSDKRKVSQNDEDAITHRINLLLGDKGVILWWKGNRYSLHETKNPKRDSQFNRPNSLPVDGASQEKKVAIMCRDQSDINIIKGLFGDELLNKLLIFSGCPEAGSKSLLSIQTSRTCFIVVDARTMAEELHHKSGGEPYEDLLRAAKEAVETKVVIIICCDKSKVSQNGEAAITDRINLLLGDKGVILWWKGNRYSLLETKNPKRASQFNRSISLPDEGAAKRSTMGFFERPISPEASLILLKTRLRHGTISYLDEDVEKRLEGWMAPKQMEDDLMKQWRSTADAELLIYQENGTERNLVTIVKEGSKLLQWADSLKDVWQNLHPFTGKRRDSFSSIDMELE